MSSRSAARPVIVSVLYALGQNKAYSDNVEDALSYVISEFGEPGLDTGFVHTIVDGVLKKQSILDEIIAKAAPRWTHDMNMMDKAILRASIYELLFESAQTPAKVVISQAVALADQYASPENRRFVNGVLGSVYREIENSSLDAGGATTASVDEPGVTNEYKVAAAVFSRHDDSIMIALVHDMWGYWTFPKGSVVAGMTQTESCAFKVEEEIGVPITVVEEVGTNTYTAQHPVKGTVAKNVTYFVAVTQYAPLTLTTSGGLDDVRWFPIGKIEKLHMYDDITQMVIKALPIAMNYPFETK